MPSPIVQSQTGYVPPHALAFGAMGEQASMVATASPLPIEPLRTAASSTPLTGTAAASATPGPFVPQLGREIVLTLSGTWAGTVALLRSIDAGATKLPATLGGTALTWTGNVNEIVWVETEAAATLYLDFARSSGTLTYRLAQ